jgi:biopolymer transport protein ExbD
MPIEVPGKRYGKRLQHSKVFGHGAQHRKSIYADLLITPLVDMFVIIVLFLIANFSATGEILNMTRDIQLPTASHVLELEVVPVVMVSATDVVLDGQLVGRVEDLTRNDMLNILELEDKLREKKKTFEDLHSLAQDNQTFKGAVNIQAHKEIPFKIVKRVMFSCTNAGYNNINFAVLNGTAKKSSEGPVAAGQP